MDPAPKALLRRLPGARRQALLGAARGLRHRGAAVECPCCGGAFARFLPHRGRPRARCPGCGALERHRLLTLFLERETDIFRRPATLLHVAPEFGLYRRFSRAPNLRYVSGDLAPQLPGMRLDVGALPFPEAEFDAVLCNHVLEHVADDRRALAEIRRVLRPGGWAILMCPVDRGLEETLEDPRIADPGARLRLYGQEDHLRRYGRDYGERLAAAGLVVEAIPYLGCLEAAEVACFGLRREGDPAFAIEDVYRCRRSDA